MNEMNRRFHPSLSTDCAVNTKHGVIINKIDIWEVQFCSVQTEPTVEYANWSSRSQSAERENNFFLIT